MPASTLFQPTSLGKRKRQQGVHTPGLDTAIAVPAWNAPMTNEAYRRSDLVPLSGGMTIEDLGDQLRRAARESPRTPTVLPSPAPSDEGPSGPINRFPTNETLGNEPRMGSAPTAYQPSRVVTSTPNTEMQTVPPGAAANGYQGNGTRTLSLAAPASLYSPVICLPKIHTFQQNNGGDDKLNNVVKQRLSLLINACREQDIMYLTMHQVMCMHTISPKDVPIAINQIPNVELGFQILNTFLSPNDNLPAGFVRWSANFPASFSDIIQKHNWDIGLGVMVEQCTNVLEALCTKWKPFVTQCIQRKSGPGVQELVNQFKLCSPKLQLIAFLSAQRSFWGPTCSPWSNEAEKLFKSTQKVQHDPNAVASRLRDLHTEHMKYLNAHSQQQPRDNTSQSEGSHPTASLALGQSLTRLDARSSRPTMQASDSRLAIRSISDSQGHPPSGTGNFDRSNSVNIPQPTALHPLSSSNWVHRRNNSIHPSVPPVGSNSNPQITSQVQASYAPPLTSPGTFESYVQAGSTPPLAARATLEGSLQNTTEPRLTRVLTPQQQRFLQMQNVRRLQSQPQATQVQQALPSHSGPLSVQHQPQPTLPRPTTHPFFPRPGEIRPQAIGIEPSKSALHQTQLYEPIPCPADSYNMAEDGNLFQFVTTSIGRRILLASPQIENEAFDVSEELYDSLPPLQEANHLGPRHRRIIGSSHTLRFRCAKIRDAEDINNSSVLAVAETSWPDHVYFQINSKALEPQRKKQWGKDLAIDVTHLVKQGANAHTTFWNTDADYRPPCTYATFIEVISFKSSKAIKQDVFESQVLPAWDVLASIKASLSRSTAEVSPQEDDELAIVDSNISINIYDPISGSNSCTNPVRGTSCLHRDAFDLDTFLASRPSCRDCPIVSRPDEWRCPICNRDARPQSLVLDGFLVEVNRKLEAEGKSDARTIIVERDGSWKIKPEKTTGSAPTSRAGSRIANGIGAKGDESGTPTATTGETEIIDLGD
ncbi:MAG: hypothetical protein M1820_003198 [Bogoriella megaspora]|nr:MAG: hypothetical protein M1820_003198 [Bogoriella megaspora]